jgi:hypothetical protein
MAVNPVNDAAGEIDRRRSEGGRHSAAGGPSVKLSRRPHLLEPTSPQDCDSSAEGQRVAGVVGDFYHCRPRPPAQQVQLRPDIRPQGRIKMREWFIQQPRASPRDPRPTEGHALLLTAGQTVRPAIEKRRQSEDFGSFLNSVFQLLC